MKRSLETEVLYKGINPPKEVRNPESLPIYTATAYMLDDMDDYEFADNGGRYYYGRGENPNKDCAGEVISFLEGGEQTLLCASGMGAISTTIFGLLGTGDHILINKAIYSEVVDITQVLLEKLKIDFSFADFTNIEEVKANIRPNTKMLYTEVISNPHTNVVDLDAVSALAKKQGAYLAVDSTFTTPVICKPIEHGADVVIHSLTKFFGGHHDLMGGSITTTHEIVKTIWRTYCLLGSVLDPHSAWLLSRSLKTFVMRVKTQSQNAAIIAEALTKDPHIKKVNHPSLATHPQHEVADRLFENGYGPMLSFEVITEDHEKINEFTKSFNLIKYVGSLGGVSTSYTHPRTAFINEFSQEQLDKMGLTMGLIRISTGIENPYDVIEDVKQALKVFD